MGEHVNSARGPRVVVCIPTHDQVPARFMYDLASMMAYTSATAVADGVIESLGLQMVQGTYVHRARQQLAEAAIQAEADFILWLDSDMHFPRDLLLRLLVHRKEVVGINYVTRGVPPEFVGIKRVGWKPEDASERLVTDDTTEGLEPAEALGMGALLMRTDVFRKLPLPVDEATQWFWFNWLEAKEQHVGEDVRFCALLAEAGVEIYADHDLSKECAHIGSFEYNLAHVIATEAE